MALNAMLSGTENQMMSLVKAMPADKYDFAPSAAIFVPSQKTDFSGVRTFGALVIHVTQANYGFGARFGGIKPDVDLKSLAQLKDKDQIVAALAASFAFLHKAIGTITTANAFESVNAPGGGSVTRATAAGGVVVHTADEYGQMVEYLRMNGVIPPASVK
ncbi:DinB family protein [Granulicella sp. dw_53]|uniref:DinB family protein n=1 Tax=Granulicella sp. dw_53 TaxID=2719792 RepID=UPI0031F67D50